MLQLPSTDGLSLYYPPQAILNRPEDPLPFLKDLLAEKIQSVRFDTLLVVRIYFSSLYVICSPED
jgi:hypothetical protein